MGERSLVSQTCVLIMRIEKSPLQLVSLLTVALAAAVPFTAGCGKKKPPPDRIILVCIDTLRADHLGAYGYSRSTSPSIDELASLGILFDRAYSTSGWTVPAVASAMTSLYPNEHGAGIPGDLKNLDETPPAGIRSDARLLAEMFREAGYATALFSANPFLYGRFRDGFEVAEVVREDGLRMMDRALSWLRSPDERRRLLYIHLMDVHPPSHFSEEAAASFALEDGTVPEALDGDWRPGWSWPRDAENPEAERIRRLRVAAYDAAIRFVDEQVGRLLAELTLDDLEDTVVLLFADHGEEFWDHVEEEHSWADDPRRMYGIGHGHTLFDELLRIPLILVGAGAEMGVRSPCAASIVDIPATVARIAGLDPPSSWRGIDLRNLPLSEGECRARPIFASSPAYGPPSIAVRLGPLKLYRRGSTIDLLFNVASDPAERLRLSTDRVEGFVALQKLVDAYERAAIQMESPEQVLDPELRRQLQALGYL